MPLTAQYTWKETDAITEISIPLKGIPKTKVDIYGELPLWGFLTPSASSNCNALLSFTRPTSHEHYHGTNYLQCAVSWSRSTSPPI